MVRCLFPHYHNTKNLITIPRKRKELKHVRGKRKFNKDNNNIINETNKAWCHIIKTYVPRFVYNEDSRIIVICHRHFNNKVLTMRKSGSKTPILGALPTVFLYEGHIETKSARESIISQSKRIELDEQLDRFIVFPIEVTSRTQRTIDHYLLNQKTEEQKRIEQINNDKIFLLRILIFNYSKLGNLSNGYYNIQRLHYIC